MGDAYENKKEYWRLLRKLADQSAAEFGMEHSGVDNAWTACLAGYFPLVVYRRPGTVDLAYTDWYVANGMGNPLRQSEGSAEGKQKSLFRKKQIVIL